MALGLPHSNSMKKSSMGTWRSSLPLTRSMGGARFVEQALVLEGQDGHDLAELVEGPLAEEPCTGLDEVEEVGRGVAGALLPFGLEETVDAAAPVDRGT